MQQSFCSSYSSEKPAKIVKIDFLKKKFNSFLNRIHPKNHYKNLAVQCRGLFERLIRAITEEEENFPEDAIDSGKSTHKLLT